VQFNASGSTDPNPAIHPCYDWDFGDGSPRANSNAPQHTYTLGTYTVTLRVMTTTTPNSNR
jgi:PKD repeat protein